MATIVFGRRSPTSTPAQRTGVAGLVLDVELTDPLPAIAADRAGVRVGQVWLLVRHDTEPIGMVRAQIPPAGLNPEEVRQEITAQLGPVIAAGRDEASGAATYPAGRVAALAEAPPVTVVICSRERPGSLRRTLQALLRPGRPRLRVLVVDSGSRDDATRDVARAAATGGDVTYLRVPEPGLARARNAAVRAAPDQTLAWIDDDVIVDEYWHGEVARALVEHPDADVLCGCVVPAELETAAQLWFEEFGGLVKGRGFAAAEFSPATRDRHNPLFPLPPFGAGANMVTRPGVVERAGWFDPALGAGTPARGGEDTLFFTQVLRAGGTIRYTPRILVRHVHRREVAELRAQLVGYGVGLTAAYMALVMRSPRVVPQLLRMAPRALREVAGGGGVRTATIGPDFPRSLLRANRRAMLLGPAAYLRGRRRSAARTR